MLGIGSQEHAAMPVPDHLLGDAESEVVAIVGERALDVGDKQAHRADALHLEWPREQHAPHIESLYFGLIDPQAAIERNPVG